MKKMFEDKTEYYNENGRLHREDGPAIEYNNGSEAWLKNGLYHRIGGPAVTSTVGGAITKYYWLNGKRHREDGPAFECIGGHKEYWFNNRKYSFEEWEQIVKLKDFL